MGQHPGEHLVQDDPGGVDVATGTGGAVADLLRRQVADGPHHNALGHGVGRLVERPGEPEVGDLHLAVVAEQDVLRLDVAVDDPRVVGRRESLEDRFDDLDGFGGGQPLAAADELPQGLASHELHHEVNHRAAGSVIAALVENGDDARGVQPRGGGGFPLETTEVVLVVRERGMHDLESDQPVKPVVMSDVDRRHTADGDAFLRGIAPVQQPSDDGVCDGRVHIEQLRALDGDAEIRHRDHTRSSMNGVGRHRDEPPAVTPGKSTPQAPPSGPKAARSWFFRAAGGPSPRSTRRPKAGVGRRQRPVFIWDGDCGFCQAGVGLLTRHLSAVPDVWPWQAVDLHRLGLTEEQARDAVQWVGMDGAVHSGAQAVAAWMTLSRQPWRTLGKLVQRPLPGRAAAAVYAQVCRNRGRLPSPTWRGLWLWARGLRGDAPAGSCGPAGTPPR